jgi:hypothetical protein
MDTDDGRLVLRETPVLHSCAVDNELCAGFLIDSSNQYQDETTLEWVQIVDEKSTIPLCLLDPTRMDGMVKPEKDDKEQSKMTSLINGIFHASWTIDLATMDRQATKDRNKTWLYFILGVPMALCVLALAMNVF